MGVGIVVAFEAMLRVDIYIYIYIYIMKPAQPDCLVFLILVLF